MLLHRLVFDYTALIPLLQFLYNIINCLLDRVEFDFLDHLVWELDIVFTQEVLSNDLEEKVVDLKNNIDIDKGDFLLCILALS